MKCDYCGKEEDLPFTCNYCGGTFCGDHRLPESHACTGDLMKRRAVSPGMTASWGGSSYSSTTASQRATPFLFSQREVRDILVAWAALALAFTIVIQSEIGGSVISDYIISFVAVGGGFVLHELMHKFTAERYGYWAEFRMWTMGIVLAIVTSFLHFIFAAPGATYISGANITEKQNGVISIAGPATNVVIAFLFLLLGSVGSGFIVEEIASIGFQVNLFLAAFNLIPIMPLDGAKVWRWNKAIWAIAFIPLALFILSAFAII